MIRLFVFGHFSILYFYFLFFKSFRRIVENKAESSSPRFHIYTWCGENVVGQLNRAVNKECLNEAIKAYNACLSSTSRLIIIK